MVRLAISLLVSAGAPAPEDENSDAIELDDEELDDDDDDDERVLLNEVIGAIVVYPQERGELQFNLKPGYRDRRDDHLGYANWEIEYGATDWLQFEVSWDAPMIRGGPSVDTVAGFGDLELGTQFTWMNMGRSPVSAALAFEVGFPTARPEDEELDMPVDPTAPEPDLGPSFGEGGFVYEPYVTLAVDFPDDRGQVFTNLGAELSTEEQLPLVNVGVFVAASFVRPTLVFGWNLEEMSITPGMTFVAGKSWEFSIGVPVGLNQRTDRVGVEALIIYEFNPLELARR
jgi:hypothetical protein